MTIEEAQGPTLKHFVVCIAILGLLVAVVQLDSNGKALEVLSGQIESCETTGWRVLFFSAHVSLDKGETIKMLHPDCRAGETVLVVRKRGLLTYRTFYERKDE